MKGFRPKDESEPPTNGGVRYVDTNFRGEKRSTHSHASTSDHDAWLHRKADGKPSRIFYTGHVLMEKRHGLVVGSLLMPATGKAEPEAALTLRPASAVGSPRIARGLHNDDVAVSVRDLRDRRFTLHVAWSDHLTKKGKRRRTAIDGRTTWHAGCAICGRIRKQVEEALGWFKTAEGQAKTKLRGTTRVDAAFTLATVTYNLVRLPRLIAEVLP